MGKAFVFAVVAAVVTALAAGCGRVDGRPLAAGSTGLAACTRDLDCGPGRYCDGGGVCALDCVTSKDCAFTLVDADAPNPFECSPCGRCLHSGTRDATCVAAKDIPCESDTDCRAAGGDAVCASNGFCSIPCRLDDDCRELGRGWSCEDGLCARHCFRDLDCLFHGWNFECVLPPGVDEAANEEARDPRYGECLPRVGGVDWGAGGPAGAADDYRGIWGMLYTAAFRATGIPLISSQDTVNIQLDLVKISGHGDELLISYKVCTLELRNFRENDEPLEEIVRLVVPDSFNDNLALQFNRVVSAPPMAGGAAFSTDTALALVGARLLDPEHDPMPTYHDLAGQYDQDRDGHPGMTLFVAGVMTGEMYMAQRSFFSLAIEVVDHDHIHGPVTNDAEQPILGASNEFFVYDMTVSRHPQADRSYFRAVRLADTASCDDVIAKGRDKHSWLTFDPHFDPSRRP